MGIRKNLHAGVVTRARPVLGTIVTINVAGAMTYSCAAAKIDVGFAALAKIHSLMSFHESTSDVSRLNREAYVRPVCVDRLTYEVITKAVEFSAASDGCFDITIAPQLVAAGLLPHPASPYLPDAQSSWRDIELLEDNTIRFHRPLWIDLGGIAKGRAVDHALQRMQVEGDWQVCINAGGDLRVAGPEAQAVVLRSTSGAETARIVRLLDGSLASSGGRESKQNVGPGSVTRHIHGVGRRRMGSRSFVSVAAQECMVADALTKIVLGLGVSAAQILNGFGAIAYLHDSRGEWHTIGCVFDETGEMGSCV